MRTAYHEQLDQLSEQLGDMCGLAGAAMERATQALLQADLVLAEQVISDHEQIIASSARAEEAAFVLLALQAPVAGDLRLVAALLHVIKHVERMGDQCVNMAKLVPLDGNQPPAEQSLLDLIQRMGDQARQQVVQCGQAFARRDVAMAQDLVRQDDVIDELNREVFHRALELGDDIDRREWAMHMMLVGRCIERIGDNAVDIGEQTAFVVTGLFREFEDASHPVAAPPTA
jgi:phosphate transport system protein